MLGVLIGGCALLGLAVGSFLNVVIYRVPRHESIVSPRSRCPSCGTPIKDRDNIPVISWLVLRGRCRVCKEAISPNYVYVEVACGAIFAGLAARMGYSSELPAFLVLFAGLLALACIDGKYLVLPKQIVYVTFGLVVLLLAIAAAVSGDWTKLEIAAISSASWFAVFFIMNLASPRILGYGDVRLALILGFGLGWLGWRYVLLGFFAANLVGAVVGITLIALKRVSRNQPIPYGVFLAVGVAIAVFAGPELISYSQTIR